MYSYDHGRDFFIIYNNFHVNMFTQGLTNFSTYVVCLKATPSFLANTECRVSSILCISISLFVNRSYFCGIMAIIVCNLAIVAETI